MSLLAELKRRNVVKVAVLYVIAAWLILQVADVLFPNLGAPEWAFGLVLGLLVLFFVPALLFSWVYELTPEGLKREKDVDRSVTITGDTGRKINTLIIALLVVAIGLLLVDLLGPGQKREQGPAIAGAPASSEAAAEQSAPDGSPDAAAPAVADAGDLSPPEHSIAVLPFVNMSSDQEQEYFSDGISEELLNLLAKIPDLQVTSRSSAFAFKGEKIDISEVARRLNVAHVLEGSVRKAGNRVRITAQLIDAESDTHMWSETYDRTLEDIFAVQDEIAATVVAQLKVTLLGEAPRLRETDPEAYALYLQARHLSQQGSAEAYEQSTALFEQALAIDPEYAPAWSGLSVNYMNQAFLGLRPTREAFAAAREVSLKALAIDPDYAPVYSRLAGVAMIHDNDIEAAARYMGQALALAPTDTVINLNASVLLNWLGRPEQAVEVARRAASRDPTAAYGYLASAHLQAGRYEEALQVGRSALRLQPDGWGGHYQLGLALLMLERPEEALAVVEQEPDPSRRLLGKLHALHRLDRQEARDALYAEALELWGAERPAELARVHAWAGDADQAFAWLERARQQSEPGELTDTVFGLSFAPVRDDPRWSEFREAIGFSAARLEAIRLELPPRP